MLHRVHERRPNPFADYLIVPSKHLAIHRELCNWGHWNEWKRRPAGGSGAESPMFRMFRSSFARGEYGAPTQAPSPRTEEAADVEQALHKVPELHREALKGFYVDQARPQQIMRILRRTSPRLQDDMLMVLLHDGRGLAATYLPLVRGEKAATKAPTMLFTGVQLEVLA